MYIPGRVYLQKNTIDHDFPGLMQSMSKNRNALSSIRNNTVGTGSAYTVNFGDYSKDAFTVEYRGNGSYSVYHKNCEIFGYSGVSDSITRKDSAYLFYDDAKAEYANLTKETSVDDYVKGTIAFSKIKKDLGSMAYSAKDAYDIANESGYFTTLSAETEFKDDKSGKSYKIGCEYDDTISSNVQLVLIENNVGYGVTKSSHLNPMCYRVLSNALDNGAWGQTKSEFMKNVEACVDKYSNKDKSDEKSSRREYESTVIEDVPVRSIKTKNGPALVASIPYDKAPSGTANVFIHSYDSKEGSKLKDVTLNVNSNNEASVWYKDESGENVYERLSASSVKEHVDAQRAINTSKNKQTAMKGEAVAEHETQALLSAEV